MTPTIMKRKNSAVRNLLITDFIKGSQINDIYFKIDTSGSGLPEQTM
jgi:hypothetical protein